MGIAVVGGWARVDAQAFVRAAVIEGSNQDVAAASRCENRLPLDNGRGDKMSGVRLAHTVAAAHGAEDDKAPGAEAIRDLDFRETEFLLPVRYEMEFRNESQLESAGQLASKYQLKDQSPSNKSH